jgi:hypothetical protein
MPARNKTASVILPARRVKHFIFIFIIPLSSFVQYPIHKGDEALTFLIVSQKQGKANKIVLFSAAILPKNKKQRIPVNRRSKKYTFTKPWDLGIITVIGV